MQPQNLLRTSLNLFFTLFLTSFVFSQEDSTQHPMKVVGGNIADPNAYPWVAQLLSDNDVVICGGSLIAPGWALTAGHCALNVGFLPAKVRLNPYSASNPQSSTETINISQIFVYPGFSLSGPNYHIDLCLLKLSNDAQTHAPVVIHTLEADTNLIGAGDWCKVLGWGSTDANGSQSDLMKEGEMEVISTQFCSTAYAGSFQYNIDSTICAGYLSGQTAVGAGAGDSGGPLFVLKNGTPLQVGVVSGGGGIITTDQLPGIYTKIFAAKNWIANTMNQSASLDELISEHVQLYFDGNQMVIESKMQVNETLQLSLFDAQGKEVQKENIRLDLGKNTYELNDPIPNGIYFVQLLGANQMWKQKLALFR